MYDILVRSAAYVWEFTKILWEGTIGFFAPGQFGFLLILFCAVALLGKYGSRALQKRCLFRTTRIFTRVVQGCGALIICFAAFQVIQAVYPLVVKAVSAIK
ncbi:hypothetical protein AXX12_11445 [Anaerosporomusa subterranea]|jgi:hypothetical protein|uniref:Uncharacterized protein n=1 Tax=Anaerosporomusa subterranea TaxID=1794912 RepID=A0A154BPI6_ANASB|nr:hypothetical protein [Anaerosporomusa subterranea]KYZ75805.1 hypothetical protein AXX12_11445 [Anaerosporomusa subterranea]MDF2501957.1 hypothetical protein [Anaerosporomusa subterranea]